MISVEEALAKVLSQVSVLEREEKPLLECLGQVLAEDVRASLDVPPHDNAAMDGYAVRAVDTRPALGCRMPILEVIGEVAAGRVAATPLGPGQAYRIMTGAPMPPGADAVVPWEDTDEDQRAKPIRAIGVWKEIPAGTNIRRAGEDIRRGELVLQNRVVLRPAEIGVLASLGRAVAPVIRRPRVAVLATGDELVSPGQPLGPGQIYESNSFSLAAQVARYGGVPLVLEAARDTAASLRKRLQEGVGADLFITSAGVSTGAYDVVKDVLAQEGDISFWTVGMKPGKPVAFGVLRQGERRVPHLGLPGNPVSSMITFEVLARPAILKMQGRQDRDKPAVWAVSESRVENEDGRRVFSRVVVTRRDGQYYARLTGPQGSGILTSMARARGLMIVPENVPVVKEGDRVQVWMLDWEGDLR